MRLYAIVTGILVALILGYTVAAGTSLARAGKTQRALACARSGDQTDQAIVDCFTAEGIAPPTDLT